jgi:hypothetical protein
MPNFFSLNITNSGSLNLYRTHDDLISGKGFVTNVSNGGLEFKQRTGRGNPISIIQLSSSNEEPRFGIGFGDGAKFSKTFDLLSSKDSPDGTEILLRSSRLSTGGRIGDTAGKINFAIQSASYKSIELSGSVGEIRARVDSIDAQGVVGSLILGTYASKFQKRDTLTVNFFKSTFSSSLEVLNNITTKNTVSATNVTAASKITGGILSASSAAYVGGNLFVAGIISSPPPAGVSANGIEYRYTLPGGGSQTHTDGRWTAKRFDLSTQQNYNGVDPDLFSIALTGSFYHSGSYYFDGGVVSIQNAVLSLGGFTDVSASLALIDAGVF